MNTQPAESGCPFRIDPTAADIHGEAAALRKLGPAARVELPGPVAAWSVTDPDLARRLLSDPRVSKDAHRHWPAYINNEIPEKWPLRVWVDVQNALTAYGDEHTRLRRLISPAFTPRRVRALAPVIETITGGLLDTLESAEARGDTVDLRAGFAWQLPLLVANTLLGVPGKMHDAFRDTIGGLFATGLTEEEALANGQAVYRLLTELIEIKRETPGDDATTLLIQAHDEETGTALSPQELLDSLLLLIGASHETTANLLDNAIVNLLSHPDQLALVRKGEASWADVVEENLRHQAPIANILMRFATEDIDDTESGLSFATGDAFVINYAAIGRAPAPDGDTAADPAVFDITRPVKEHLSFGHGVHFCLGSELARLESRIALSTLFERFPGLALTVPFGDLRPMESFISNGHRTLPATLHPAAAAPAPESAA